MGPSSFFVGNNPSYLAMQIFARQPRENEISIQLRVEERENARVATRDGRTGRRTWNEEYERRKMVRTIQSLIKWSTPSFEESGEKMHAAAEFITPKI